jgi:transposase
VKGFYLPPNELSELRIAHRSEQHKRSAYKINAVILLGSGWNLKKVKEALLLDEETLRNYVERYREGGIENLVKTDHKGSVSHLKIEEIEKLCEELETSIYLTTNAVVSYVEKEFNVSYKPSGMRDLLHRLGYEYKKPKLVPGNPDHEAQEIFVEQYEDFMLKKPNDVEVLFMDAVHPEHNGMAAYGWIKKGAKRELKTNSGRQRLNLHGAMNAETLQVTVIESETVNADSTINLFEIIEQAYPLSSRIIIILDNAKYHYSKEVKAYLENSRIQLAFLPSYSPNLNLIERLWKFFKKKVLYNKYYENLDSFRKACINFFSNINNFHDELSSLMSHYFEFE